MKKDKIFDWTPECQNSFDTLKQWFTAKPVLMMPDQSRPFQIEADASKYASRAVLTQMDSNGDRHPVVYFLKISTTQKGITRSMTGNYSGLFMLLRNGDITFKDQDTQPLYIQITRT